MYQVDSATGSYTEVAGSPFASAFTNGPTLLATEPTGTYLAVVNSTGLNAGESSVESFQIDAVNQALIPVPGSLIELVSTPVGAAANPTLGSFHVYLGPNPSSPNPFYQQDGDLLSFTIDPTTGLLGNDDGSAGSTNHGRSFGADPLGRFVVAGQGQFSGLLQVTAADGTEGNLSLGSGIFPQEIFVGPGQHFVYATIFSPPNNVVHIYIVDPVAWMLTEAPSSPLPGVTSVANLVADPTGPFIYRSTAPNQVRVYSVDPSTGYFSEVASSPFTAPGFGLPVAFSLDASSIQPITGPVATLTPPTLSLGSVQVGTPSTAQTLMLSSTGDQALSVNAIGITGANATEFAESDTCGAPTALVPAHSCFISIVFTPAAAGSRAANLSITDNASGSPQSVPLSGTGTAPPPPAPAITFMPGTLNFPSLSQNATSSPLSVTVTNSGNAALTISSIILGGNNPADFSSPTGNCIGAAIAPNASCTVTETFTPVAAGARQATLSFADNAAGSPHFVTLNGIGIASPTDGPVLKFVPTSVTFPIITQGLASTPISITISNTGTSPLHISSISAGGNSPIDFTNSLGACATATIAANASCTASITFSPVFSGPRSETLSVTDDAPNSPQVLNIFANAAPAFALTGTLSASVTAGQTASFNLQLTPGTDFNGTLSLVCSGAPLHATCMAPSSVVLNTGVPSSLTVAVPTKTNAIALPTNTRRTSPRTPASEIIPGLVCILAFFIWFLVLYRDAAGRPRSRGPNLHQRKAVYAMSVVLVFLPLMFVVNGCGGGASSTPAPQSSSLVTPSGTYSLVLTPSAMNAAGKPLQLAPIQFTLVVN
ncbi:MAG: choice-of-anchor D domain-containing protein [Candidatus Acidiferrum sp.]